MLHAHLVEDVRRAEAAAMSRLPDGALMQRAAAGLAAAVLDLLGVRSVHVSLSHDAGIASAVVVLES